MYRESIVEHPWIFFYIVLHSGSMRTSISLSSSILLSLAFVGCTSVDTTGISADTTKQPSGSPTASVVVTEFADFQCPACKSAHALITLPLLKKHGNTIRFDFKQFPLRSIHPYAMTAAQASECAADQGKFWEYANLLYEHQEDLSKRPYEDLAKKLGLNEDLFHRCLTSEIKEKAVLADIDEATKLSVNSTPSYFVNGVRVEMNLPEKIDDAIAAAQERIKNIPL